MKYLHIFLLAISVYIVNPAIAGNQSYANPDCKTLATQALKSSSNTSKTKTEQVTEGDAENPSTLICKVSPWDAGKTILVTNDKVMLVDSTDGHIFSEINYELKKGTSSDDKVSIDTARYILAPNTRAFGIRSTVTSGGNHGGETDQYFVLYAMIGDAIHEILDPILVSEDDFFQSQSRNKETTNSTSRTLVMGKIAHHGFYDLIVHTEYLMESCSKKCSTHSTQILEFNGDHYLSTPDLLKTPSRCEKECSMADD
jgi:hypothetical protein